MGHLHALWHAALEQQEDGDLSLWTDDLIAEFSAYQGDASQYVSLLRRHGWLDGKKIHDWMDYAGRYLEGKYRTSNPDRLNAIKEKHSQTRDRLKTDERPSLDRQPTVPTKPTVPLKEVTDPEGSPVDNFQKELSKHAKEIHESINIAQFLAYVNKASRRVPPANLMCQICRNWIKSGKNGNAWGYFVKALKTSNDGKYYADLNEQQGNWYKKQPVTSSIKEIMKGVVVNG